MSVKRRRRLTGILGCGRLAGGTLIAQSSREESIKIILDILSWRSSADVLPPEGPKPQPPLRDLLSTTIRTI